MRYGVFSSIRFLLRLTLPVSGVSRDAGFFPRIRALSHAEAVSDGEEMLACKGGMRDGKRWKEEGDGFYFLCLLGILHLTWQEPFRIPTSPRFPCGRTFYPQLGVGRAGYDAMRKPRRDISLNMSIDIFSPAPFPTHSSIHEIKSPLAVTGDGSVIFVR